MKIFHKKFLNQEELRNDTKDAPVQDKAKINYWLNQVLIWGIISFILYFVYQFATMNFK